MDRDQHLLRRLPTFIGLASIAALSACSDGATGPDTKPAIPAALLIVGGQEQTGVVGKELGAPIRVKLVDSDGSAVPNQIVNFRVTSGGGSVFAGAALTSADGTASERWTLGRSTADEQTVEARAVHPISGEPLVFGVFRATPLPDAPASLTKLAGDGQQVSAGTAASDSLAVRVADQYGNAVPNLSVTWAVIAGGGTVNPPVVTTGPGGLARTSWTAGPSGPQTVTASLGALAPATFTATFLPAHQLLLQTPATGAEGGLAFGTQPVVVIADAAGTRVPGVTHTVGLTVSAGGSIVGSSTVAAVDGVARFTDAGVDGPAGNYVLTYSATMDGVTRVTTQSLAVSPGTPTKYVVVPSAATAEVGATVTITAQLSDANNAPVPRGGRTVTWGATGAPGSLGSPTSTTNSSGVATVAFTLDTVFSQSVANISATDGPFEGSTGVAVTTAPAAKLAFQTPPSSTGWRVTMRPAVRVMVQDRYGNTVVSSNATVALAIATNPGGAELTGGESRPAVDGVAEFASLMLDQPGVGYTLRSNSGSLVSATSPAFDVSSVATLATSPEPLLGLGVAGSSVYYTTSGSSADGHVWKVPATGGASVLAQRAMFNHPSGRVISDGATAYVLALGGINTRNGTILVFPESGPVRGLGLGDTASGKFAGADLEFDGTYFFTVYWPRNPFGGVTNRTGIVRVRLSDGSAVSLLDREWPAHRPAIAVAGGQLFYTDSTASGMTIERKSIEGGTATTLVPGVGSVDSDTWRSMLVAGNSIYWSDRGSAAIERGIKSAPLTGGVPTVRVPSVVPSRMQTDGTYLYVVDNGSIRRYRLSDFTVTTIVENDSVGDIALDDYAVYWVSNGATRTVKKAPR